MSGTDHASLISFLAAPVLVVDPEGHIIYANPAFERRFPKGAGPLQGEGLAAIFEGGGREAILTAVAGVCQSGTETNFRLMESGCGYLAVASPIESDANRVGVMILLTDEPKTDERLLTFHGQIQEPLDEAQAVLDELFEQTGGRRAEQFRSAVERGMLSLERVRKWSDELRAVLVGRRPSSDDVTFDPVRAVREVVGSLEREFADAEVELDLLMPAELPTARGEPAIFESALMGLLRHRLSDAAPGSRVTVTARSLGESRAKGVLLSVVDSLPIAFGDGLGEFLESPEPRVVREAVAALGGRVHSITEPSVGRVTAIRIGLGEAS